MQSHYLLLSWNTYVQTFSNCEGQMHQWLRLEEENEESFEVFSVYVFSSSPLPAPCFSWQALHFHLGFIKDLFSFVCTKWKRRWWGYSAYCTRSGGSLWGGLLRSEKFLKGIIASLELSPALQSFIPKAGAETGMDEYLSRSRLKPVLQLCHAVLTLWVNRRLQSPRLSIQPFEQARSPFY